MAKSPENEHPIKAFGWAASDTAGVLAPFNFSRRSTGEKDVQLKVLYCGICHSDLHMVKNEWGNTIYPIVPGEFTNGTPLLCAGITTYSPLKYFGLDKPGLNIGVVGLGGLGHMAVKFAKAFGAKVTVVSTSISKKDEAIENLGADSFLLSRDSDQMQAATSTLDGILDAVSAEHPVLPLLNILKPHGKLRMLGAPPKPLQLPVFPLLMGRKIMGGSIIGGVKETQEMLDFAAKHNITPEVEVVSMDYVNTAMERLLKADVKYRFVLDVGNTLKVE